MENDTNSSSTGMTLVGKYVLDNFIQKNMAAKKWIENWVVDVEGSIWRTPADVKKKFPAASFLSQNTVIFNVKGNKFRLETNISYKNLIVNAIWAGTHGEYDKRNKKRDRGTI